MPGHVEGHILIDAAEGSNLLEVVVTFLVGIHREYQVAFPKRLVLFYEAQRYLQQRHVNRDLGLCALSDDPKFPVVLP